MTSEKKEQYLSKMWKSHTRVRIGVKWEKSSNRNNMPIYILDRDPVLNAKYMTFDLMHKYMDMISMTIINFRATEYDKRKSGCDTADRVDYMFYNQRTAYYFYKMFEAMRDILIDIGKPYKVSPYFKGEWLFDMNGITGPMDVKDRAYKGIKLIHPEVLYNENSAVLSAYHKQIFAPTGVNKQIENYRIMYMLMGYLNSEFPLGAPHWYNCMRCTIYDNYNSYTRLRTRIDTTVEGDYSYYYSVNNGKSWIEIPDIPKEMRLLIDSIIYNRNI